MILSHATRVVIRFDFRVRLGIAAESPTERATIQLFSNIRSLMIRYAQLLLVQAAKKCELLGPGITICDARFGILELSGCDESLRFDRSS